MNRDERVSALLVELDFLVRAGNPRADQVRAELARAGHPAGELETAVDTTPLEQATPKRGGRRPQEK